VPLINSNLVFHFALPHILCSYLFLFIRNRIDELYLSCSQGLEKKKPKTKRVESLGVKCVYSNPVSVAQLIATVDNLCSGQGLNPIFLTSPYLMCVNQH